VIKKGLVTCAAINMHFLISIAIYLYIKHHGRKLLENISGKGAPRPVNPSGLPLFRERYLTALASPPSGEIGLEDPGDRCNACREHRLF